MNPTSTFLGDILLLCIVGLMTAHTLFLINQKRLLLLDPLYAFWAGILVIYVIQPLTYRPIFAEWHSEDLVDITLEWTLLGLASVIGGYEWSLGLRLGKKLPYSPATLSPTKLSLAGYGFIMLGVIGYFYLFASAGGMEEWLSVGRGGTDYENISGYIAQLADLLPLGIILLLFHVELHATSFAKRILIWLLTALIWWWFLYLGSRSRLIGLTVGAMGAYYLPKKKAPPLLLTGVV